MTGNGGAFERPFLLLRRLFRYSMIRAGGIIEAVNHAIKQ
jgi:hypothetical protein